MKPWEKIKEGVKKTDRFLNDHQVEVLSIEVLVLSGCVFALSRRLRQHKVANANWKAFEKAIVEAIQNEDALGVTIDAFTGRKIVKIG